MTYRRKPEALAVVLRVAGVAHQHLVVLPLRLGVGKENNVKDARSDKERQEGAEWRT